LDIAQIDVDIPSIDLAGTKFNIVQTDVAPGDTVDVQYRVHNVGADDAERFKVLFYLSRNDSIGPNADKLLGAVIVDGLAGGSTSTGVLTTQLTLPGSNDAIWNGDGKYYIGMYVDGRDQVSETREGNNRNRGIRLDYDAVRVAMPVVPENVDTAGNRAEAARNLGIVRYRPTEVTEFVGRSDFTDFYKFKMRKTGRFILDVDVLSGNADVSLKTSNGRNILARSQNLGAADESIVKRLSAGTYYLEVYASWGGARTNYDMSLSARYPRNNNIASTSLATLAGMRQRSEAFARIDTVNTTGGVIDVLNLSSEDEETGLVSSWSPGTV
jgi:hypothetical protein